MVNDVPKPKFVAFGLIEYSLHFLPVSELDFSPSGKRDQQ
jgi:hypothetical protein